MYVLDKDDERSILRHGKTKFTAAPSPDIIVLIWLRQGMRLNMGHSHDATHHHPSSGRTHSEHIMGTNWWGHAAPAPLAPPRSQNMLNEQLPFLWPSIARESE